MRRSVARMNRLIDDLLDAASIDAGHLSVNLSRVPVTSLVAEVLETMSAAAAGKTLLLVNEVPGGLPDLLADDTRLQQVLLNLIGNAIKFTPAGGSVTVGARVYGGAV